MPQLDKINWFFILTLLIIGVIFFLVIFIKYVFYSWRKVFLLKQLTTTNLVLQQQAFLSSLFTVNGLFLHLRKVLFQQLQVSKTQVFSKELQKFEQKLS